MDASVRLDHMLVAMESANAVHAMLELGFPEAPDAEQRAPLHVALVLDRSGSMAGDKLETTKACATHLVRRLRPDDELAIITFDNEVSLVAGLDRVHGDKLAAAIAGIWPGGSTNLSGGWLKGIEELRRSTGEGPRAVVLLTDGQANVGVVEPDRLVAMARGARDQGALTSTIGFGADFDEDLLSEMADAGGGNAHYAPTPDAAPAIFAEEFEGLAATVAQNVSVAGGADLDHVLDLTAEAFAASRQAATAVRLVTRCGDLADVTADLAVTDEAVATIASIHRAAKAAARCSDTFPGALQNAGCFARFRHQPF